MAVIEGRGELAIALARALGLKQERIVGFTLRCYVSEIVSVCVEHYPDTGDVGRVVEWFNLHAVEAVPLDEPKLTAEPQQIMEQ